MGDLSLGETTMVTFVHSADWQLGKPFSRVSDDGKRTRLQEQRIAAVRRIGEVVKKHDAAFVVVAGDVFDSNSPTNTVVADACDAIKSIGAPVYVIPGNHDHAGPGSVWSQPFFLRVSKDRAPNLRVLLDREPVQEAGCILFPCPLSRRQSGEDPCTWIRNHDFSGLEDRPRIVLAHGSTLNFRQESDEEDNDRQPNLIALDRLPISHIDYVALGDWHGMVQAGEKAWYSGSHETDRFPKVGQTTGHVALVEVRRGGPPTVQPLRTGHTRWLVHSATFATDAGPAAVKDSLDQLVGDAERGLSLLKLSLGGNLGLAGHAELSTILEEWQAGLLDLRLDKSVAVAPTADEIDALAHTTVHPLIAHVARELQDQIARGGEEARLAGTAIALLHEFANAGGAA
ncbi:MAG: DNA repair exonuclease [Planctomycetia bacterium]|nr:DNA repair exonuclease [Planctomycetia bacterium]